MDGILERKYGGFEPHVEHLFYSRYTVLRDAFKHVKKINPHLSSIEVKQHMKEKIATMDL